MRIARVLALALTVSAFCAAAEIPQATRLLLRVINSVSTRTAKPGDAVYMQTVTPIAAGGKIVVPAGSHVVATITRARRSKRIRGRSELSLTIDSLALPTGEVIKASPTVVSVESNGNEQQSTQGTIRPGPDTDRRAARAVARTFVGALGGFALGGIFGAAAGHGGAGLRPGGIVGAGIGIAASIAARGPEVELSPGILVDAVFESPVSID